MVWSDTQSGPNIWIVGDGFGFPNGYGAAARVLAYAKGLQANGANVRVVCLRAFERLEEGILNAEPRGSYDGIPFEYACGTTLRGNTFLQRRWLELKGAWGLMSAVRAQLRDERINAVHIYSADSLAWILTVWAIAKWAGAKTLIEVCEFPYVYCPPTMWVRMQAWILTRLVFRILDGCIVISRYLQEFVQRVCPSLRVLRVPILVDATRWADGSYSQNLIAQKQIAYVGNLAHNGEVSDLLRAFALIVRDCPDARLRVIGDSGSAIRAQIEDEIDALDLTGRVELVGTIKRDDLPRYLASVDVLALFRKDGTFSKAGFPTKLGEYLATGKPVVVTSTGENPFYLQDHVNAFLAPPGDVESFAAQLRYVIEHPDEAQCVGARGKLVAIHHFDCRVHGKRLVEFIETL